MFDRVMRRIGRDDAIAIEQGLVRIPSYTTEEEPLARWLHGRAREMGLPATLSPVPLTDGTQGFNVVCELRGAEPQPTLLITGHMDHAPALGRSYDDLSHWQRPPFEGIVEDDWLYGKGAQDEKGGLCAMLLAGKALVEERVALRGTLVLAFVQGHKRVSSGTRHLLASGLRPTYVINAENSGSTIVPRWVGRAEGRLHVRARAGGRELHFHFKEIDPSLKTRRTVFEQVARVLAALGPEMAPPTDRSWMSFTPAEGLTGYPQYRIERLDTLSQMHATILFQVRTVPGQNDDTLRGDLGRLLDTLRRDDPYFDGAIEFPTAPSRAAGYLQDDHPLVQAVAAAHRRVLGRDPEISALGRLGAAADASLFPAAGFPTIMYGPGGGMTDVEHQRAVHEGRVPPDERISVQSIVDAARVYAAAAMHVCG